MLDRVSGRLVMFGALGIIVGLGLNRAVTKFSGPSPVRGSIVVAVTTALFATGRWRIADDGALFGVLVLSALVVVLFFVNVETWLLPYEVTLPGILLGVLCQLPKPGGSITTALLGLSTGFLSVRAAEYLGWVSFRREVFGGGIKFMTAMVGAFLGWEQLLWVFALSIVQGAVLGLVRWMVLPPQKATEAGVRAPFTPAWGRPGLTLGRRLALLPYILLVQPIPDERPPEVDDDVDGVESPQLVPTGPVIAVAVIEVLLIA
jgi:leader peptidase (prepilin peptidase)/N-methyltransferase